MNGAVREALLVPWLAGIRAHQVSTLLLVALILAATRLLRGWLALPDGRTAWEVGAGWVACTLAFEFLAGHFLFRRPWSALLADYDVTAGRLWILIPGVTLVAPWFWRSRG